MSETCEVIDREQIEMLRSLDDGEGAVLAEIIHEFLATSGPGRDRLLQGFGEGDSDVLGRAAHTLKGASANVGATALADVCAELEMQARAAQFEGAHALVERFEVEFARATTALQSELSRT